jgi:hypothetical protein
MDNWIKTAADKIIARRDSLARHAEALEKDLANFWEAFVEKIESATREFNGYEGVGESVLFERPQPGVVTVSKKSSHASVSVIHKGKDGVATKANLPEYKAAPIPRELTYGINDSGQLCFVWEESHYSMEEFTRMLLEPLFGHP